MSNQDFEELKSLKQLKDLDFNSVKTYVLCVANQKGGVGKTTTSVNLADSMNTLGKKVLVIDLDPQGNTTSSFGINKEKLKNTIFEFMLEQATIFDSLIRINNKNIYLLPANARLNLAELNLLESKNSESKLQSTVGTIKFDYDVVIIDCPPTLNMLTINALAAANGVLIPVQCEYFALEGLRDLMETIKRVKTALNSNLEIAGLLRTMYVQRNNLSNDISDELISHYGIKVLQTLIPRNIRLAEAPSNGITVLDYDKSSSGAIAYMALANELNFKLNI